MRSVTVNMRASDGRVHPLGKRLAEDEQITREALHAIESLEDGTIVMLIEIRGNLDRYQEIMTETQSVHEYSISGDESGYCYCRVETSPLIELLVKRQRTEEFIVEFPIPITGDGGYQITMVGRAEAFANAPSTPPDGIEMELISMSPYQPHPKHIFSELTERQHEVLQLAIQLDYYQNPRQTSLQEIADDIGIAASTVGKHLRSIEKQVFSTYVR